MKFTDDDLKALKRETDDIFVYEIRQIHIKALIARLEAAEALERAHIDTCPCNTCKAWRKAAGK